MGSKDAYPLVSLLTGCAQYSLSLCIGDSAVCVTGTTWPTAAECNSRTPLSIPNSRATSRFVMHDRLSFHNKLCFCRGLPLQYFVSALLLRSTAIVSVLVASSQTQGYHRSFYGISCIRELQFQINLLSFNIHFIYTSSPGPFGKANTGLIHRKKHRTQAAESVAYFILLSRQHAVTALSHLRLGLSSCACKRSTDGRPYCIAKLALCLGGARCDVMWLGYGGKI